METSVYTKSATKQTKNFSKSQWTLKRMLKTIFSNYFFILFSFMNLFIPFYATIIASLQAPVGLFNVISVGLSVSFITIFNQFLFLISIALVFVFKRNTPFSYVKNDNQLTSNSVMLIMLIYSCLALILFLLTSLPYIAFSAVYANIQKSIIYALKFIGIIATTLLLNGFIYLQIIEYLDTQKWKAILIYFTFFSLHLILIPFFYFVIPWHQDFQTIGLGLGFLVSSLLITLVNLILLLKRKYKVVFDCHEFKTFWFKSNNFVWNFLLSTIMKVFLVMFICLGLNLQRKNTPVALMTAKIIWYNSLFFCGFFADGVVSAIDYCRIINLHRTDKIHFSQKCLGIVAIIVFASTLLINVGFNFVAIELTNLYPSHQLVKITNEFPPTWPYFDNIPLETKGYLWAPEGIYNFQLSDFKNEIFVKTPTFALLYLTIYHCFINTVKILGVKPIKYAKKFDWKSFIINFVILILIMSFIATFGVAFNNFPNFVSVFFGLDSFSFALMIVAAVFFLFNIITFILIFMKIKKSKKQIKNQVNEKSNH